MNKQDVTNSSSKQRVITAFAILAIALVVVLIDIKFITWFFLGIVMLIACNEMLVMLKLEETSTYVLIVITWIVAYFYLEPALLSFAVILILLSYMTFKNQVEYKKLFVFLYPLAPMLFIFALPVQFGIGALVWLVFIVGITDTAAYYGGKNIGVTPLSPISPNKTWEGVYTGVVGGTFIGTLAGLFVTNFFIALFVSLFVSIASIFGDLFESYLKRQVGIKDSGNLLPGHGGMLDRADGYLFGAMIMYILLKAFF